MTGTAGSDGRDPELDELLSSFDDVSRTSDGSPVPQMEVDELIALFGDDEAAARPDEPSQERAPSDDTVPMRVVDEGGRGDGSRPTPPVADVPVETGIDWLGAPVFGELDDATEPAQRPDGAGGSIGRSPGGPEPAGSDPADRGETVDTAALDATTAGDSPAGGHGEGDGDGAEPRVREVAIPVGRVGVLAVDQETGEMLAPVREEELPTGKAFFGRTTIIITDDEGPDVGYLDDELAVPESQPDDDAPPPELDPNTIYIGDRDEGLGPTSERLPRRTASGGAIDPRVRARRSAVRREERSRRLLVVGTGIGLVVMALVAVGVAASPIFGATDIRVSGAVYTDGDVLADVIADLEGDPVLLVDTGAIEERLAAVPWVERVRVDSRFPHTVVIDIRERRALAAFRGGDGRWRVIDVQGRVLDVLDGQPLAYMPIAGSHPDTARGQFAGAPYASAATLVQVLPGEIRALTRSIGLDAVTGTLTMELVGGVAVRLGSADDLDDKLARLLSQVRGGLAGVVALDVSTAQIGVVRG